MIALPNNCRAGKFSVHPANWNTPNADISISWRIVYWFYDDELKQKKQISIRGMNTLTSRKDRQAFVKAVIRDEMEELRNGFNPLRMEPLTDLDVISARTGLKDALNYAMANVVAERNTVTDIRSSMKYVFMTIHRLRLDNLPVENVAPKHIFAILHGCSSIKTYVDKKGVRRPKKWGPYQFNRSRTYLSLLFGFLQTSFIITGNPVLAVRKAKETKRIRETTTAEQRQLIFEYTRTNMPAFHRFINIFFSSGSRLTELLRVRKCDVRIEEQRFKVMVKKGKSNSEQWRTITKAALPYWQEVLDLATSDNQFLFSEYLRPGDKTTPIRAEHLNKRWRKLKKMFNITADLYSLKHTYLDVIAAEAERIGIDGRLAAQKVAGHSSPVITMAYLIGEKGREHERKKLADLGLISPSGN